MWHELELKGGGPIQIAKSSTGTLFGLTGFFGVAPDKFASNQIEGLKNSLITLSDSNRIEE